MARFTIQALPTRDLVHITLSGFFELEDVARFDAARTEIYGELRCARGEHLTLCDTSEMKIQSQDVVTAFGMVAADPRFTSRRLAFVVGASLARMQARRVTDRDSVAHFNDLVSAEAWLFAPSERSRVS